jgi:hypothetical protein
MPVLKDIREVKNIKLPKSGITIKIRDGVLATDVEVIEQEKSEIRQTLVLFSRVIEDWDATDEKEQKLPITPENINLFGFEDTRFIIENLKFVQDFLEESKTRGSK